MTIKPRVALFLTVVSLLNLLSTFEASASDPSAFGVVANASGVPIPNVSISASSNGTVVGKTQTDSTGHYALYLPDGVYSFQFTPPSTDYSSLASLPISLPQNWPLNVVLTTPTVGKVFLKGFLGLDQGTPAASPNMPATIKIGRAHV